MCFKHFFLINYKGLVGESSNFFQVRNIFVPRLMCVCATQALAASSSSATLNPPWSEITCYMSVTPFLAQLLGSTRQKVVLSSTFFLIARRGRGMCGRRKSVHSTQVVQGTPAKCRNYWLLRHCIVISCKNFLPMKALKKDITSFCYILRYSLDRLLRQILTSRSIVDLYMYQVLYQYLYNLAEDAVSGIRCTLSVYKAACTVKAACCACQVDGKKKGEEMASRSCKEQGRD